MRSNYVDNSKQDYLACVADFVQKETLVKTFVSANSRLYGQHQFDGGVFHKKNEAPLSTFICLKLWLTLSCLYVWAFLDY